MRNFKLFTMIFSIMATVCFTACDDKDDNNKQETNTCTPATCEMVVNATEMGCDDAGHCVIKACADTFKVAEDAKSCEADAPACTCDPACKDNEDCIKGEGDKCECREKDKQAACDPACDAEKQDCVCEADKCECKDKNAAEPEDPCKDKAENADCSENKTCQKGEGDKLECKDKPADSTPAEPTQPSKPE
jgi:hypothetical protein